MVQKLGYLKESPSQTAGPYVHIGTNPNWVEITGVWKEDLGLVLAGPETKGERILVKGRIIDGAGDPLKDALIEIWQADANGFYNSPQERRGGADPHFVGWGRQPADGATGEYRFETIKPGRVPYSDGRMMAPHAHVFQRRGGGQRRMSRSGQNCPQGARADPDRHTRRGEGPADLHLRHPSSG
jgi:protocatechuate 3,4-dioxygenase, alpha subunit